MPMRKLLLFALVLLPTLTFGQWQWLNPQPTNETGVSIVFTDNHTGILLTTNDGLMKTSNLGATWAPMPGSLRGAQVIGYKDSTFVQAGFTQTVSVSTDNGITWKNATLDTLDFYQNISVVSRDTIFIAGYNTIFRSDDRGITWKKFKPDTTISSACFANSKIGYANALGNNILKTTDGGATWTKAYTTGTSSNSSNRVIRCYDANTVISVRDLNNIFKTTDGGATWTQLHASPAIYQVNDITFVDRNTYITVGASNTIYRTTDGGANWSPITTPDLYDVYRTVAFIDSNTGFTGGNMGRILKTTDGGATWVPYSPTYDNVTDFAMPAKDVAYFTTPTTLFKSTDKGLHWAGVTTGFGANDLQHCYFTNSDTGFVTVGHRVKAYRTTNGGAAWQPVTMPSTPYDNITCVQFLNKYTGYMALTDTGGTLLKTQDGGANWTSVWTSAPKGRSIRKFYFTDEQTGFASQDSALFKTTDGGATWALLYTGHATINVVTFSTPQIGYVSSGDRVMMGTTDGGATWTKLTNDYYTYGTVYAMKFLDKMNGFIDVGDQTYRTIDRGATWTNNLSLNHQAQMNGYVLGPDSSLYAYGVNGVLVRTPMIPDVQVSPLKVDTQHCVITVTATMNVSLGQADSIHVDFNPNISGKTTTSIAATPYTINSTQALVSAKLPYQQPGAYYDIQLKFNLNGQPKSVSYSNGNWVVIPSVATPGIGYEGYSWFCNGEKRGA
jgi:photosystem II stability/assembly factor-like uncharacterized protein